LSTSSVLIQPRKGWQPVDLQELWRYRELLGFLVWRDIKIRYKQTILGGVWAVLQPLIGMVIFGLLFSRIVQLRGDGPPYLLFVYAGLAPWTFFANALGLASNSLVGSEHMIRKVYFPRIMIPLGMIIALGLDMIVSLAFMGILMAWYQWPVTLTILSLPLFMAGSYLAASGLGLFLSSLNVQYRDVKYVVPFFTQMAFFVTPVIYPVEYVPASVRPLLALNPMAGMVEGFRFALFGSAISWPLVWTSLAISCTAFLVGLIVFRRMEHRFADVI
jgi:lipopolysaccharide transport system permease protein